MWVFYTNTLSYFDKLFAEFFLEWEMFQLYIVEKNKIHTLFSVICFRKSCRLWDNVEESGGAREAADDNMAHGRKLTPAPMHPTYTCTQASTHTYTHTQKYVIVTAFPRQQWLGERPSILCCTTLPVLLGLPLSEVLRWVAAFLPDKRNTSNLQNIVCVCGEGGSGEGQCPKL